VSYINPDSEDAAIEQPTIALFKELGWETLNCYNENFGPLSLLGRETMAAVVLPHRLKAAVEALNPNLSPNAVEIAIQEVTKDRSTVSPARANQDVYQLLKNGVKVTYKATDDDNQEEAVEIVKLIDWNDPDANDFFLGSQFWISGDYGKKRADLIGFVNGIPLVFIELKASHKNIKLSYEKNLSDYKDTVPQAFWYNGVVILSNGSDARIGSMTAGWEHFAEWKKIDDEKESGVISLDTMIRGVCEKRKLLDFVENFTLFDERKGEATKLIAKNHQFLGVNNAIAAVEHIKDNRGKLGVFWHTQGSGKSYSMVFFSQKVLRKVPGNWTFVIVTDRDDLDGQIYRNFANTGALLEDEKRVRADSGDNLKRMLNQEDHRYVFTLIQKFHTEHGERYPVLSTRPDIIVITDEAHRSQYDVFAGNMRSALPNAAFIGFTGTPLMAGEERTKDVFGEYVSIYNFKESVDDQNTVPLYYENRIPELQLTNDKLTEDIAEICDRADLDDDQERKLEKEFAREYHLITRDDRLDRIGEDIVAHFMGRGVLAKAMVISIDKATAVRTFDKVQKHWKIALARLREELTAADPIDKLDLEKRLKYFEETDMAVVVSSEQNEIEEFKKKGLDIAIHRRRMVKEDLETKFKNPDDPLRIVFVCAMWITGFDVPSCSTIYLDKPMKNHTLMQTIARANRVWGDKTNGLIVDYVGVFRNLEKALAIYGTALGEATPGVSPVHKIDELVTQLREVISSTTDFCTDRNVNPATIEEARGFERVKLIEDAVAAFVVNDDTRRGYLSRAGYVDNLFKSLLPDAAANEFGPICKVFRVIADKIRSEIPPVDISEVMAEIEALLNQSIAADDYELPPVGDPSRYIDLSQIDFDSLRERFEGSRKAIEVQKLRAKLTFKLARMIQLNRTRIDFLAEFQKMIEEYNNGAINVQVFFDKLLVFAKRLDTEEKRGLAEQLNEEELVIFDLLTKPDVLLTSQESAEVKKVAKMLLEKLKKEKLVLDWRKQQTTRAMVRVSIEDALNELPRAYSKQLYDAKCDTVYQHFYEAYSGHGKSVNEVN
jgi:type I restriction enzyme, R subunit